MQPVEPQEQHKWLQKLVGDWTSEMTADMGPGQPPTTMTGKESFKSLGGLWVIGDGQGEMPGGAIGHTMMTLGYDPQQSRFVGTFIGSMMAFMWIYSGSLDGDTLTLEADGPSMTGTGTAKYHDIIEFKSDDHRQLRARTQTEDGSWKEFMVVNYHRQK